MPQYFPKIKSIRYKGPNSKDPLSFKHYNAAENLVVFASLVAAAQFAGVSTELTVWGCMLYFWARLAHYVVYTLGIPVIRTLCFVAAVIGELMIAIPLLQAM